MGVTLQTYVPTCLQSFHELSGFGQGWVKIAWLYVNCQYYQSYLREMSSLTHLYDSLAQDAVDNRWASKRLICKCQPSSTLLLGTMLRPWGSMCNDTLSARLGMWLLPSQPLLQTGDHTIDLISDSVGSSLVLFIFKCTALKNKRGLGRSADSYMCV